MVGFCAQFVAAAFGMGYGVISSVALLSIGVTPVLASASIHTAGVFTTALSGILHLKFKNIDGRLFRALAIPGAIGGVIGTYALAELPADRVMPFVALHLFAMGILVIRKAFTTARPSAGNQRNLLGLGFIGGLLDAIGGGGWGPIVASTLIARGESVRHTVGSVQAAKFFVTIAQSAAFFLVLGTVHWNATLGLLIGGVIAAPLGARLCARMPRKSSLIVVGALIIILSTRMLYGSLFATP